MPGNQDEGMLEDLCLLTVSDHPTMNCVEKYLACLKQTLLAEEPGTPRIPNRAYFPKNSSKAKAQAFLAGMYESVNSVGLAAKRGCWNLDHPSLQELKSFIQEL